MKRLRELLIFLAGLAISIAIPFLTSLPFEDQPFNETMTSPEVYATVDMSQMFLTGSIYTVTVDCNNVVKVGEVQPMVFLSKPHLKFTSSEDGTEIMLDVAQAYLNSTHHYVLPKSGCKIFLLSG